MLTLTTEATYRAFERSTRFMQDVLEACRRSFSPAGAGASRQASPIYQAPGAPEDAAGARVARLLDDAHAELPPDELGALLLNVRDAALFDDAVVPLPERARRYANGVAELMRSPGVDEDGLRLLLADYTEQVASRPAGAGTPAC